MSYTHIPHNETGYRFDSRGRVSQQTADQTYWSRARGEHLMPQSRSAVPVEFNTGQPMATPKQIEWITKCRAERDLSSLTPEAIAFVDDKIANGITRRKASELLDKLFALPKITKADREADEAAKARRDLPTARFPYYNESKSTVPNGRYALVREDDAENRIHFYNVFRFKDGGVSLKRVAGPEAYQVRGRAVRASVLREIEADISGASRRYGFEFKVCGRCQKGLTRVVSRKFGLGPDCSKALGVGDAYEALAAEIRAEGRDPYATVED
jgi:hypothetical protein